ncbi:hypothetical protein C6P45_001657 [Maudiozyma exigua]|uniref:N-acetyltransferase domain-containing protein n=1 Tax=Maudiozyma exigua TaxID=34358 RepID=A0A9P6WE43_MAUEX|nr:hypothetical protein C6P45_001657 [Kazachstania exigua]
MPVNEYNQVIAEPVPNWTSKELPGNVTLNGKYCTIVPLDLEKYCPQLFEAYKSSGDDSMWTFLPLGPFANVDEYIQTWKDCQKGTTDVHYAIIDNKTQRAVGEYALRRCDPKNGVVEVGYVIFSPLLKRSRTATEAHYLLAKYVFDDLKYRRYEWQCNSLNLPSRSAAERLGFTFEGIHRQIVVVKGRNRNTDWLSMLDTEWPICKAAFEHWLDDSNFDAEGNQLKRLQDIRATISD